MVIWHPDAIHVLAGTRDARSLAQEMRVNLAISGEAGAVGGVRFARRTRGGTLARRGLLWGGDRAHLAVNDRGER
jgi:hypothetical protein